MKFYRHRPYYAILALLVAVAGCKDKQEIKVYRVSKADVDNSPSAPMASGGMGMPSSPGMPGMPGMPAGGAGSGMAAESVPDLDGTAPTNWETRPPSSMRQASYLVKGDNGAVADVSLVVLAGGAGGSLENVNRWLSQLGQPAISDEKFKEISEHVTSPLGDVTIVDLEGLPAGADSAKDGRILGGMAFSGDKTFFFKMRGNAALVESQKDAFTKWVSSVNFKQASTGTAATSAAAPSAPAAPAAPSAPGLPPSHPSLASGTSEPTENKPQAKWETPEGWTSAPAASMRYASYTIAGKNDDAAEVAISVFPGETGGDLANVNRWRGQVGLEPVDDADLKTLVTKFAVGNGEMQVVDLKGQKNRLLAGWIRNNGNTWFFKLTGSDALVGSEKEKFVKFLHSVQFNP